MRLLRLNLQGGEFIRKVPIDYLLLDRLENGGAILTDECLRLNEVLGLQASREQH